MNAVACSDKKYKPTVYQLFWLFGFSVRSLTLLDLMYLCEVCVCAQTNRKHIKELTDTHQIPIAAFSLEWRAMMIIVLNTHSHTQFNIQNKLYSQQQFTNGKCEK